MQLTANEELELRYMQALGLKWIAKEKEGVVFAFEFKPKMMAGEDHGEWRVEDGNFEIMALGKYNFIEWIDEPMEIDKLLRDNGKNIELIEPSEQDISLL